MGAAAAQWRRRGCRRARAHRGGAVGAAPARFAVAAPEPGTRLRVFGYPGKPTARQRACVWTSTLKGEVGGQLLQVESRSDQTVKAQPGYSGSPVWDHSTGEAVGLLQAAPFADEPERDAYLLPPLAVAQGVGGAVRLPAGAGEPIPRAGAVYRRARRVFFGRDADIAALTARVRAQPVVVVVGPSGVGKSSLVQAGLIPALRAAPAVVGGADPAGPGSMAAACRRAAARAARPGGGGDA